MNKKLKSIVLSFLVTIVLVLGGMILIKSQAKLEAQKSCYNLTTFDYIINSPSNEQVEELQSSKEEVSSIFACYSFNTILNGNNSSKVSLLLSDQLDSYETGFFNDDTKLIGEFDENGIALDQTAADKLSVKVGDSVSVSLAYQTFTFSVSAIYMPVSYVPFDEGLALASFSEAIKTAYGRSLTYDFAFIDENVSNKCAALLQEYIPLGPLMDEQTYIDDFKSQNNCPPAMSQEEWESSIKNAYQEYKDNYLSQEFKDSVQEKNNFYLSLIERLQPKYKSIKIYTILSSICICILYSILFCLLINVNLGNDRILAKDGKENIGQEYVKMNYICSLSTLLISGIALLVLSFISSFFKEIYYITLAFTCPILVGTLIIRVFISNYISRVYK